MTITELHEWAEMNFKKDKATLISEGVKENKINRVQIYLRGTIDSCKNIIKGKENENKHMRIIKDYAKEISKCGLSIPDYNTSSVNPILSETNKVNEK